MKKSIIVIIYTVFLLGLLTVALSLSKANSNDEIQYKDKGEYLKISAVFSNGNKADADVEDYVSRFFVRNGEIYIYLPSFADYETVYFEREKFSGGYYINEKKVENGSLLSNYLNEGEDGVIRITNSFGKSGSYPLHVMKSENISATFVNTDSADLSYVNESTTNKDTGKACIIDALGNVDTCARLSKFKARGNGSFVDTRKKSYSLIFEDDEDVLSMGKAKDYALIANAFDASKLRNYVAYDFARYLELNGAVEAEYTDLFVNGLYVGNYLLCEKVEVMSNRLDIGENAVLTELIMERKAEDKYPHFIIGDDVIQVSFPEKADEKTVEDTKALLERLYEDAAAASDKATYDSMLSYIDKESFEKMLIEDFILDDSDANIYSTFYYIKDGKVCMGPVWDYDKALGNMTRRGMLDCYNSYPDGIPELLFDNESFREDVKAIMDEKALAYARTVYESKIPKWALMIEKSVHMDESLYGIPGQNEEAENALIADLGDFNENVKYVSDFMEKRTMLLNDYLNSPDEYANLFFHKKDYWVQRLYVRKGEALSKEDIAYVGASFEWDGLMMENGELLDEKTPINGDLDFYKYHAH